ncbi:MAG: Flp pilus assembly complex ATPase component [bacterium]|nr:Flp pilus assembly complex ATPase component [bacterium]
MNKIIVIDGPKEGIGKTSFAVNFATQYAINTNKKVVVLDCDTRFRSDAVYYLNSSLFETVPNLWNLVEKVNLEGLDATLFKGRITFDSNNVGILNIAKSFSELRHLKPEHLLKVLAIFVELYTFVIDIESLSEDFILPIYDLCDNIFWIMDPFPINLKNTVEYFNMLLQYNFNLHKFTVIINRAEQQETLSVRQINSKLSVFEKTVVITIPEEKSVAQAVARRQLITIERPHTVFARSVRELLDILISNNKKEEVVDKQNKSLKKSKSWRDLIQPVSEDEASNEDFIPQTKESLKVNIKSKLHKQLIKEMSDRKVDLNSANDDPRKQVQLKQMVEGTAAKILSSFGDLGFTRQESQQIVGDIIDDALGLGPLEKLLRDKSITEIMVNKKDQIYIEKSGKLIVAAETFRDDEQIIQVIRRIIAPLGRRIDESVPLVDARLKDGSRVNAIIPPLAVQGSMLTIRRFPEKVFDHHDFMNFGSISEDMVAFLEACVISEKNIIVSGGTGSGKTTLLNMLSSFIPSDDRIVTVEDVAELRLQQEHVGRLESRPPNIEGKGEITIRDLVKNTLRMRPDRIVVGECRGGESLDMLQAMNTGHDGSLTTIHANSSHDMVARLEAMVLMSGAELPVSVIRSYISSAVKFVVQIARLQDGSRKVLAITEVLGINKETMGIDMQDIFIYHRTGLGKDGKVEGDFLPTGIVPKCYKEFGLRGLDISKDFFKKKTVKNK